MLYLTYKNGKVSDAILWATDLKSYPVEVEVNHNKFDGTK